MITVRKYDTNSSSRVTQSTDHAPIYINQVIDKYISRCSQRDENNFFQRFAESYANICNEAKAEMGEADYMLVLKLVVRLS